MASSRPRKGSKPALSCLRDFSPNFGVSCLQRFLLLRRCFCRPSLARLAPDYDDIDLAGAGAARLDRSDTIVAKMQQMDVSHHHVVPNEMNMMYHQDDMRMDDSDLVEQGEYDVGFDGSLDDPNNSSLPPRAVHQCNICNKIFVSFKGLQQHAVIHTDQKPFGCDICGKSFRFKSNLFEHRSVHSGFTPHACPYCGKTCRLKGNLKKHIKTHVSTKEELDEAWKPFASNRRPPADIPEDAIIVRGSGDPYYTPPSRPRKRKLGLGNDAKIWTDKIRRGEILPNASISDKMRRLADIIKQAEENMLSLDELFEQARALSFERFDCPLCKSVFMSRMECAEHIEMEHPMARVERPLFCEVCLKTFADRKSMEQHESYHKRVHLLVEPMEPPEILLPTSSQIEAAEEEEFL
ncbi:hypothetical protein L596_015251 [Steinernema carpocapsae]|uniref:C2H2-type domain-containing protein n=1 Tax=Steinernema carpocapsae TaxID=34508 RepID=A0A4U5NFF9_STECR|nr:hypothetical protein L596_015251 [Steinernema carpocapsae]